MENKNPIIEICKFCGETLDKVTCKKFIGNSKIGVLHVRRKPTARG